MLYAGLDLHQRFSVITVMDIQGKEMVKKKFPNNGELKEFFHGFDEPMVVAMESTRSWCWLYDLLEENGIEVRLKSFPLRQRLLPRPRQRTIRSTPKFWPTY